MGLISAVRLKRRILILIVEFVKSATAKGRYAKRNRKYIAANNIVRWSSFLALTVLLPN